MMTTKAALLLLASSLFTVNLFSQNIPLVYEVENTGADFAKPSLPAYEDLPVVRPLPDPFGWSDGSGRSTDFSDWGRRRAEIKAEIEHYQIGTKPDRPEDITATYADRILTVNVTVNGETLTLTAQIFLPRRGEAPFSADVKLTEMNQTAVQD